MSRHLVLLAGDGIGPEIMAETEKIIHWFNTHRQTGFTISHGAIGGGAFDQYGTPCPDQTIKACDEADAILLGAVGGPQWDHLDFSQKPERALLRLRKHYDLFANLRPAFCFSALADSSSLKSELIAGLDLLILRELTGGIYFGEPRGITKLANGARQAVNTQIYTTEEIRRIARVAFSLARQRKNRVLSSEKANVMESGMLWREEVQWVHDHEYPDVVLEHMYADALAMQLVRAPKQFDVIVTDNLFGDILSDAAAMLTGSLGMLPSASLGAPEPQTGKRKALYEPVHGSAPDIAGKGIANPLAAIMSFAMCLRYSFSLGEEAEILSNAISKLLADGYRTPDIWRPENHMGESMGEKKLNCLEMGDRLIATLNG